MTYRTFQLMIQAGTPEGFKLINVVAIDAEAACADARATYGDDLTIWHTAAL